MILQALAGYYERLLADHAVQPQGFQEKEIPWVVELAPNGRFLALRPTGGEDGRGRKFVVPAEVKKSVNIAANLLWDNPEYVFGWPRPGLTEKQAAKVPKRHEAFMARLQELPERVRADPGVSAVITFLETDDFTALRSADGCDELKRANANVSFRLAGDNLVCERPAVRATLSEIACETDDAEGDGWCLITGRRAAPSRLHPSIKGVRGAQTSGANLVSFNLDASTSHGWSQGANAPVSQAATHAYTAALNHLLARGSERHRLIEGDTTFVFWAAAPTPIVDQFAYLLGSYGTDQQESDGAPVRQTFDSVRQGLRPSLDDETPFYVLGLAPNAARLAVRFWHEGTVANMAHNVLRHFEDLEVVGLRGASNVPKLWRLIAAGARKGEPKNLQDNLRGQLFAGLMASILDGLPYPGTLLARTVARCRAECPINRERDTFRLLMPIRAALIKAVLNRRFPAREITVNLDLDKRDVDYRLGRLFALLENIQRRSQHPTRDDDRGGSLLRRAPLNVTIRDRYFGAFMTAPRSVFPQLMHLKNAHLKKLHRSDDTRGLAIFFEHQIDEILSVVSPHPGLPASLSLEEQGRFILGYHHQRNAWRGRDAENAELDPGDLSEAETTE
jgi:CRISPR-associated protein Csd1